MIKACIFDLDGTLLDTLSSIRYYVNRKLEKMGYGGIDLEKTRAFVGDGAKLLIRRSLISVGAFGEDNVDEQLLVSTTAEYVADYDADPYYLTEPYVGIPEALKLLRESGIKLAVLSNKPHSTVIPLVEHYFPGTFDVVRGSEQGIPAKPSPDAAHGVCLQLGVLPSETAFFGDTDTDIKTAKAYGARLGVGVLWGFRSEEELKAAGADALLTTPMQIPPLITQCADK